MWMGACENVICAWTVYLYIWMRSVWVLSVRIIQTDGRLDIVAFQWFTNLKCKAMRPALRS